MTATNRDFRLTPRKIEQLRAASAEIGQAWTDAWAAASRAPRAINPRRGR